MKSIEHGRRISKADLSLNIFYATFAFPYVIQIFPGFDTQPLFSVLGLALLPWLRRKCYDRKYVLLVISIIMCIMIFAVATNLYHGAPSEGRLPSFLMLLTNLFLGAVIGRTPTPSLVLKVLVTYLIFTAIYFLTKGAVEQFLISSRPNIATNNFITGRGATTLSPEPSFFAYQIFSIYVLAKAFLWEDLSKRKRLCMNVLTLMLLAASASGLGAIASLVIILTIFSVKVFTASVMLSGIIYNYFTISMNDAGLEGIRALELIRIALYSPLNFIEDASIAARLDNASKMIIQFVETPALGNGFSIKTGGGILSILPGLGFLGGLLLTTLFLIILLIAAHSLSVGALLFSWVALWFVIGPIGIPPTGFIIGLMIQKIYLSGMREQKWRSHLE